MQTRRIPPDVNHPTRSVLGAGLLVGLALAGGSCGNRPGLYPNDSALRLNQIQVLGSHNSYHIEAAPLLMGALRGFSRDLAESLEYSHAPLVEQFENLGIRQIELDVFADPAGGLYADPAGETFGGAPVSGLPEMHAPGFKVLHVQDIDYDSRCRTFVACLNEVRAWSRAHPGHVPMLVLVEAKDEEIPDVGLNFVVPLPIGPTELDALDAEIRSVFAPDEILTPDDVRGERATLAEAIANPGWPTLAETRGRILFALDNGGHYKADYLAGHPSLAGRVMFVDSAPGDDFAAFAKRNDPIGDRDGIAAALAAGLIVRTRADADTRQGRSGDTTQRDTALASGAQFVSTDYELPDPDFGTGYSVAIPGGTPARCNPVTAPPGCAPADIENPDHLVF